MNSNRHIETVNAELTELTADVVRSIATGNTNFTALIQALESIKTTADGLQTVCVREQNML